MMEPLTRYWNYLKSFKLFSCQQHVRKWCGDVYKNDCVKMQLLFQYCYTRTNKVIKCCCMLSESDGYLKAKKLILASRTFRRTVRGVDSVGVRSYLKDPSPHSIERSKIFGGFGGWFNLEICEVIVMDAGGHHEGDFSKLQWRVLYISHPRPFYLFIFSFHPWD